MKKIIFFLTILLLLTSFSCNTTEPEIKLELALEDVSCIEAWLKITGERGSEIILKRDDTEVERFTFTGNEMVIMDDSLLPNKTYTYQVSGIRNPVSSSQLSVTTLDTTSHNFTWQTFTIGGSGGSSSLNDVAIIDENNIWAVGEIYVADTSDIGYTFYNAVYWNGLRCELKRIAVDYNGNQTIAPLHSIFILPDGNIILSSGLPYLPDGNGNWKLYHLWNMGVLDQNDGSVYRVWGTSIDNLYFVGLKGTIVHYLNGQWKKIESGTDLNINDVWGIANQSDNEIILCTAYNFGSGGEKKLLKIQNNKIEEISWINKELYTVWFNSLNKIYAGGEGLFIRINKEWKQEELPPLFKFDVSGNKLNDIWTVGGFGFAAHFNGLTWRTFDAFSLSNGNYKSLAIKGDKVVFTGSEGSKAIITIANR